MSINGTGASLIRLLKARFTAMHGGLQGYTFKLISTGELTDTLIDHVTLFLYRVDADVTRRHQELPPASLGEPRRRALVLDLRYLLTVWGRDAEREQQVLGDCMSILDAHPVLAGDLLDPATDWVDGSNLRVALDQLGNEDLLRIWEAVLPSFRLSVPYVVRTVYLQPHDIPLSPPVLTTTEVLGPGGRR